MGGRTSAGFIEKMIRKEVSREYYDKCPYCGREKKCYKQFVSDRDSPFIRCVKSDTASREAMQKLNSVFSKMRF